ncbi:MAG: glycosyltransferase family 4 protein [Anaerolineae bacterium]
MLHLAWCSPFPAERSGIADYSVDMVEAISEFAKVTLFVNDPAVFDVPSLNHLPRYPIESLSQHRFGFDLPIYQMGNHLIHQKIYEQAIAVPGVVVLHEFWLQIFLHQITLNQQQPAAYFREAIYESPPAAFASTTQKIYPDINRPPTDFPGNQRLINSAIGIMAHSQFVADQITQASSRPTKTKVIRHYALPDAEVALWPDTKDKTIFACAGLMTSEKQIDKVLDALQQLVENNINAELRIIGEAAENLPLTAWIHERRLDNHVVVTGFIESAEAFVSQMAEAHIIINLRQPTVGETSGVVMRSMAAGRPVIVYDHGWYSELPDGCLKIEPDSPAALLAAMKNAAADHDRLKALGKACHAEIQAHYRPEQVAREMVDWLEKLVADIQYSVDQ